MPQISIFRIFFLPNQKKGDYHVIISSKLSEMICFWKWISLWFLSGPLLGHILLTKSFYNPFGRATTVKVPLINHLIHLVTIQNSLVTKNIKILLGSPYFLAHELGSRRWNWKFREKNFWNPNPELLLHSSYLGFNLGFVFKKCFFRNFQFHRRDPNSCAKNKVTQLIFVYFCDQRILDQVY